jgi:hypothetical protein
MSAFVTAGAGFLLAVLWFDLMFDVQVLGQDDRELPEQRLSSIAAYYARVTTAARPMNRLIAAVMLGTLAAIVAEIVTGDGVPSAAAWISLALAAAAVGLVAARTVPNAVRLGTRADTLERQSALARAILREHVFCFASIGALIALQLSYSYRSALRGQRARKADAVAHPGLERPLRAQALGIDAQPPLHLAPTHHHRADVRPRQQYLALLGADANKQPALAGGGNGHVAAEQEREAAEHRHLGDAFLAREQLADAVGEILVVGHRAPAPPPRPTSTPRSSRTRRRCRRL